MRILSFLVLSNEANFSNITGRRKDELFGRIVFKDAEAAVEASQILAKDGRLKLYPKLV